MLAKLLGANWKTTLTGTGAALMALLTALAAAPYELGDIATIIPPEWKARVASASLIAAFILRIWNSIQQKSRNVTGGTHPQDATGQLIAPPIIKPDPRPMKTPRPNFMRALLIFLLPSAFLLASASALETGTTVASVAYESSHILKASANGRLISLIGYNSKASAQFIQLFDSATLPADAAVPIVTFTVAATSNFSLDVPITGLPFTTGIVVTNSSTGATKTIGSADCWFTAVVR